MSRAIGRAEGSSGGGVVEATARGGLGGIGRGNEFSGGSGGTASAAAEGYAANSRVDVVALQVGGHGGLGAGSPDGTFSLGGDGADSEMVDAVKGSAGIELVLEQRAIGGNAGIGRIYGKAGSARSVLNGENPGGGDLTVYSRADAGAAFPPNAQGEGPGRPGDAFASASGRGNGDRAVEVTAIARGGFPNLQGMGGNAAVEAWGESPGAGSVVVTGEVTTFNGGLNPNGPPVDLLNVVDGRTAGDLTLIQRAEGGGAASRIDTVKDLRSLEVELSADGLSGAVGTAAETSGNVRNDGGSVNLQAFALGGQGSRGDGGLAVISNVATTAGDGHAIVIGTLAPFSGVAFGGSAFGNTGRGGEGRSNSRGIALADSPVTVIDRAQAGPSSEVAGNQVGDGELGSDSSSFASGENAGDSLVKVSSISEGSRGGLGRGRGNAGGTGGTGAVGARGVSSGGTVTVTAVQTGGSGGEGWGGADGGAGAGSAITDGVSGSTAGLLTLTQQAIGAWGGRTNTDVRTGPAVGGPGGEARSTLRVRNEGGGELLAVAEARGGAGGSATSDSRGGDGGHAEATVLALGSPDRRADAVAFATGGAAGVGDSFGGFGGQRGLPGSAAARSTVTSGAIMLGRGDATSAGVRLAEASLLDQDESFLLSVVGDGGEGTTSLLRSIAAQGVDELRPDPRRPGPPIPPQITNAVLQPGEDDLRSALQEGPDVTDAVSDGQVGLLGYAKCSGVGDSCDSLIEFSLEGLLLAGAGARLGLLNPVW